MITPARCQFYIVSLLLPGRSSDARGTLAVRLELPRMGDNTTLRLSNREYAVMIVFGENDEVQVLITGIAG